ncbi:nucleolin [Uranotaenia lowii]|uniref:nucleolin n=1 Tax=Uranotaenia lowii TaxID=190385 RepID=UPI00247AF888|nr:nucleolin [Uranotaenia lowii]
MRSRTEMVTTQLEGSDFDEESDFEASEEDWKPTKDDMKPKKVKSPTRAKKAPAAGKNGKKKPGRKPAKRTKRKESSDEEDDDDFSESEETIPPPKARKLSVKKEPGTAPNTKVEASTSGSSSSAVSKPEPLQRKVAPTPVKSFPDKGGFLTLYLFKGDLKEGIINNHQVCLWRRDGSSLLQKYLRDKTITGDVPHYNSSMVYSCWEDKRSDEYLEVKVRCVEQAKQIRVELTNVEELEARARGEYESFVAVHGEVQPRSSAGSSGSNNKRKKGANSADDEEDGDDDNDEDDDDEEDEDDEDGEGTGADGQGNDDEDEESEDDVQEE